MKLTVLVFAGLAAITSATTIHVNRGCILINDEPVCQNYKQTVAVIDGGIARFRARFNGNDKTSIVAPGCTLDASWPSCYQDIFFGADNCLYDAGGNSIDGQCCAAPGPYSDRVLNPYV